MIDHRSSRRASISTLPDQWEVSFSQSIIILFHYVIFIFCIISFLILCRFFDRKSRRNQDILPKHLMLHAFGAFEEETLRSSDNLTRLPSLSIKIHLNRYHMIHHMNIDLTRSIILYHYT